MAEAEIVAVSNTKQNDFALVPKPSRALEKAKPGAKRILSGMVADTLILAKKAGLFRIILLDDEAPLMALMEKVILHRFKNVTVQKFQDGESAWQELLRADPDFLIMDMIRPGMTGWDLLPLLSQRKVKYPILVNSGYVKEKAVRECAGSELNIAFLQKPFRPEQLYAELSKQLGQLAKPVFSILLGVDSESRDGRALEKMFVGMITQKLGGQYDLKFNYFYRSTQLAVLAEEQPFDIIIVHLHNLDGGTSFDDSSFSNILKRIELLQGLKKRYGKPVFVIAASDWTPHLPQWLDQAGLDAFLFAPFSPDEFWNAFKVCVKDFQ